MLIQLYISRYWVTTFIFDIQAALYMKNAYAERVLPRWAQIPSQALISLLLILILIMYVVHWCWLISSGGFDTIHTAAGLIQWSVLPTGLLNCTKFHTLFFRRPLWCVPGVFLPASYSSCYWPCFQQTPSSSEQGLLICRDVTSKYVFLPWQQKFEISHILAKLMPERELPNKHALSGPCKLEGSLEIDPIKGNHSFQWSESLGAATKVPRKKNDNILLMYFTWLKRFTYSLHATLKFYCCR